MAKRPRTEAAFCEHCGARIIWARTEAGQNQALNWQPDPTGNTWAFHDATGWRARSTATGLDRRHPLERIYMPHGASCPGPPEAAEPPIPGLEDHRA